MRPRIKLKRLLRINALLGAAGFLGILLGYQACGFERAVLLSDDSILVSHDADLLTFLPKRRAPSTGLLFLPGAMVDPTAYAPMARAVAARGYRVTIISLPMRLAPSERSEAGVMEKAAKIIERDSTIQHWAIAGHSKGGKLAAQFVHKHPDRIDGLILIGTSHPDRKFDLSSFNIDVTKIYATCDGVASREKIEANRRFLPARTEWVVIEGGNHTQFGYYSFQLGDRTPAITRRYQQKQLVDAILMALERITL